MLLSAGTRVGAYEITGALGAGGMGEVYRARDARLKREVALKILPESFASDPERLARFQREAEVLASLNHPNIAAIYGLEERALVLELVEGETLADRIARGAIPLDEALPIAKQIAEALEAAHERGIIHRDLKPANIKINPDGVVKVLDFGLAKLAQASGSEPQALDVTASPTITSPAMMTAAGMILGTAAYMSPEQAKGREADKRSDVWAFGCVLYEMLTGRRPFAGEDVADTLANVLKVEPDWSAVPPGTPVAIHTLLQSCLVKDRRLRVGSMSTALFVLDNAGSLASAAATATVVPVRPLWRRAAPVAAALVVGGILALVGALSMRATPAEPQESRFEIATPPGQLSFSEVSPDGSAVLFSASIEGKPRQLWLRPFASESAQPIAGTENATFPFWSGDSRSIAFSAAGQLMRLDLAGGSPRVLTEGIGPGAWAPDGSIVYSPRWTSALFAVRAAGGEPTELTRLGPGEASHRYPEFLPDGRHFLFYVAGTAQAQGIYLGSLEGGDTRRLLDSDSAAVFAPPDHLLFRRQDTLLAQRLDLATYAPVGDAFSVAGQVSGLETADGEIAVSTSRSGLIAYRAPARGSRQFTWFDRAGRTLGTLGGVEAGSFIGGTVVRALRPRIAPDGRTIAVVRITNGNQDVWLVDAARGVQRRFTSDAAAEGYVVWAPGSDRLAFTSRRNGPQNVWLRRVDGGGDEPLRKSTDNEVPIDWSPDGRFVLFTKQLTGLDLWAAPVEGGEPVAVATTNFIEDQGRFSPDGGRVAYQSDETGRNEIYVVPFPGQGVPTQISLNGGTAPQWREDGRELFYQGPDNRLMAVAVRPDANGGVDVGTSAALITIPPGADFDVTRDGQRILVNMPVGPVTTPPIIVIQNWKPRP